MGSDEIYCEAASIHEAEWIAGGEKSRQGCLRSQRDGCCSMASKEEVNHIIWRKRGVDGFLHNEGRDRRYFRSIQGDIEFDPMQISRRCVSVAAKYVACPWA